MSDVLCPQCGQEPWATYFEKSYGVAPQVAMGNGWPLGHQWAQCHFGHRWVPALLGQQAANDGEAESPDGERGA